MRRALRRDDDALVLVGARRSNLLELASDVLLKVPKHIVSVYTR